VVAVSDFSRQIAHTRSKRAQRHAAALASDSVGWHGADGIWRENQAGYVIKCHHMGLV
jgi:hypothetical protein